MLLELVSSYVSSDVNSEITVLELGMIHLISELTAVPYLFIFFFHSFSTEILDLFRPKFDFTLVLSYTTGWFFVFFYRLQNRPLSCNVMQRS